MLSFAYKCFDGHGPEPGELDDEDQALLAKVEGGFETVGALNSACKFRAAPGEALAREANVHLDRKAPWFQLKEDGQAAASTVYVTQSVCVVDNLKTILPHTSKRLHKYLGYDRQLFGTQPGSSTKRRRAATKP